MQPEYFMLTGVPAVGKSTWIKNEFISPFVVSSDSFIEFVASQTGETYNQVFQRCVKEATAFAEICLQKGIEARMTIVHDQTNLSLKSRAQKLKKIPLFYKKTAVSFTSPDFNDLGWRTRLASRPGKTIPDNVLYTMIQTYVPPSLAEGFDEIIKIDWTTGEFIQ